MHHLLLAQQVVQTARNVIPGELSIRSLDVSYPDGSHQVSLPGWIRWLHYTGLSGIAFYLMCIALSHSHNTH